jgi:protein-disulfide isomerase
MKQLRIITIALMCSLIFLGCTDKQTLKEIQDTQQQILAKITDLEKQITTLTPRRRPTIDYNKVHNLPVGKSGIRGDKNAPLTITEFSDFQCPYCARLQPTLEKVLKAYPKEVRLVYKHYPLSFHKQAQNAAKATEAAGEQGKYWEMHDIIFENFNKLTEESFKGFAEKLGLDVNRFTSDYGSNKYDLQIQQDMTLARSVGVSGTPTLFLNGKRMQRRSFEDFKNSIEALLKKKS